MGLAAEVAFWSVLSLFPALLATASAIGWLESVAGAAVAGQAEDQVLSALEQILTDEAGDVIRDAERLFNQANPGLLTLSALGALWTASRGFAAIIRALDVAYDLEESRNFVHTRVLAVAMSVGSVLVGALMLGVLVVGPLLGTGQELADRYDMGEYFAVFWDWVRWPLVYGVMVAWATTVLHLAPNHRTPWRWDLPGAVLATALWGLFSFGLRYYLMFSGESNQILGILGGSLIAMIWLFLMAVGLLVGGELNAALMEVGLAPPDERREGSAGEVGGQEVEAVDREVPEQGEQGEDGQGGVGQPSGRVEGAGGAADERGQPEQYRDGQDGE